MADKVRDFGSADCGPVHGMQRVLEFDCPGCGYGHSFYVPRWKWNGSLDKPSFEPSLLVNRHDAATRCHSWVTDGRIRFYEDSYHGLAGQTVDLPDWEDAA